MSGRDGDTRARLLKTATRLFAAEGFQKVTVRDICRAARANVAAVNYHFSDKMGLYREVLFTAIETMRATTEAARLAGVGRPPEEQLEAYVRIFLQRVVGAGHDSWIHQLMAHEIADPTPALDLVVDKVIRPRLTYISEIVAEMLQLPVDDDRVRRCAVSLQFQCHAAMQTPVSRQLLPDLNGDPTALERLAAHITAFSIGGIRFIRAASTGTHVERAVHVPVI